MDALDWISLAYNVLNHSLIRLGPLPPTQNKLQGPLTFTSVTSQRQDRHTLPQTGPNKSDLKESAIHLLYKLNSTD